jgi:hypothetical protein
MAEGKEKEEVREIKGIKQTDVVEVLGTAVQRLAEQERLGTTTTVIVPVKIEGTKYTFAIRPMDTEQQTSFAVKYPNADKPDKLSSQMMANIIEDQKQMLVRNVISTPDGLPMTMDYVNAMKPDIFKVLIEALAGEYDEDFLEK